MKIVRVIYTANSEFSEQNQSNIRNVMKDLQNLNNEGIKYNCCLSTDGKTFTPTTFF